METNTPTNSSPSCLDSDVSFSIYDTLLVTRFFTSLPLSIFVLFLGHRRWRRQRRTFVSHSDAFTYHLTAVQLVFAVGCAFNLCGKFAGLSALFKVGMYMCSIIFPGELSFHMLTCVERYLAVVHPVTYLRLKQSGGVRIRNISIGCVWLLCFGWMGAIVSFTVGIPHVPSFCMLSLSLVVVSFCSLSVLCVLIRPGPGEVGGDGRRVDRSKQRAFYTVTAIMGVLLVYFLVALVAIALDMSRLLGCRDAQFLLASVNWFGLPSSLVSPLLFLLRVGKLGGCK